MKTRLCWYLGKNNINCSLSFYKISIRSKEKSDNKLNNENNTSCDILRLNSSDKETLEF